MDDDDDDEDNAEEMEPKVSSLELFSDLVMAVSIHIVAHPLETAADLWHGEMAVPMYLVRVFLLWRGWQSNMSFTNVANLWSPHGMLTGPHYFVVFCFMVCLLLVAQACNARCATRAGFGVLCACFVAYQDWMCETWPVSFLVPICMLIPALLEVVWIRPLSEKAKRPTMRRHSKAANRRKSKADDLHH